MIVGAIDRHDLPLSATNFGARSGSTPPSLRRTCSDLFDQRALGNQFPTAISP